MASNYHRQLEVILHVMLTGTKTNMVLNRSLIRFLNIYSILTN